MIYNHLYVVFGVAAISLIIFGTAETFLRFNSLRKRKSVITVWERVVFLIFACGLFVLLWHSSTISWLHCLLSISILLFLASTAYPKRTARKQLSYGMLFLLFFNGTCALMLLLRDYNDQALLSQGFDYKGLMRITSVSVGDYQGIQKGKLEVSFGGTWACPISPDKYCTAILWDPTTYCDIDSCTNCSLERTAKEKQQVQQCMETRYPNFQAYLDLASGKSSESETVFATQPSKNTGWPTIMLQGNCTTCKVKVPPSHNHLEKKYTSCTLHIGIATMGFIIWLLMQWL